ncbi:hypothetical protein CDD82_4204 [Ophiocordyceps australis]|uniref:YCII-related domain-containing protein n=1 Tax=Ophiocordyceps australis TaxID=1399860 RepID=A0A2C5Z4M3_9HYPO|nr:hypothetical protein CDD82_4204 [Ophiocordyceps australis]
MASSIAKKYDFIVLVPDKPNAQAKRLQVRPLHMQKLTPKVESGTWKLGGAILNELPKDDNPNGFNFAGSALICVAENKDQVIQQLRDDVYATEGVWDVDNAQIYPFICATR